VCNASSAALQRLFIPSLGQQNSRPTSTVKRHLLRSRIFLHHEFAVFSAFSRSPGHFFVVNCRNQELFGSAYVLAKGITPSVRLASRRSGSRLFVRNGRYTYPSATADPLRPPPESMESTPYRPAYNQFGSHCYTASTPPEKTSKPAPVAYQFLHVLNDSPSLFAHVGRRRPERIEHVTLVRRLRFHARHVSPVAQLPPSTVSR